MRWGSLQEITLLIWVFVAELVNNYKFIIHYDFLAAATQDHQKNRKSNYTYTQSDVFTIPAQLLANWIII